MLDSPPPTIREQVWKRGRDTFRDQSLSFFGGALRMVAGRAYPQGADPRQGI